MINLCQEFVPTVNHHHHNSRSTARHFVPPLRTPQSTTTRRTAAYFDDQWSLIYLCPVEDYNTVNAFKQPTYMPNTAGSSQAKRFRKAQCPIVERLTNYHMIHGRNNSKKLMDVRIVKHATDIIHLLIDAKSIQIIIDDVINRLVMGIIAG